MKKTLRVGIVGLGPIGVEVTRAIAKLGSAPARPDEAALEIAAAVDVAPALRGKSLDEIVAGAPRVPIEADLESVLARGAIDAIALTTASKFARVTADLERAVARGVHVISTCEEMTSWPRNDAVARSLDARAKERGVTLLATGVNPGFVMDRLVLALAATQVSTERVRVTRHLDAAKRRGPFRKKIGEGLTPAEFEAGKRDGWLGHVGLGASCEIIARALFGEISRYTETLDAVIGDDGRARGLHQTARAEIGGKPLIEMDLKMVVGQERPHDRIELDGDPPLDMRIDGGTQGDRATVGAVVRALARVDRAPRGLVTVADAFV